MSSSVPSLDRGLAIVEAVASALTGLGTMALTRQLGIPRNSVFRLTQGLLDQGWLRRDRDTQRFHLGHRLLGLFSGWQSSLLAVALTHLHPLRDQVHETVLIGQRQGDELCILDQVLGTHPFKYQIDAGSRVPLHCTAPGKALLAALPREERQQLLARLELHAYTVHSITDPDQLERACLRYRKQGWACDASEILAGCHCVAAAVTDASGYPIAAIWATGPAQRLPSEDFPRLGALLQQCAAAISADLSAGASVQPLPRREWQQDPPAQPG